jgi:molecular chaperone DnaJ
MTQIKDYYGILGVDRDASLEDLKKAFKQKAFETHPDRNSGDKEAEQRFKNVNEAYQVLSDPQKKSEYDNPAPFSHGEMPFVGFHDFTSADNFFNQFFGDRFPFLHNDRTVNNINGSIQLNLKDIFQTTKRNVTASYDASCPTCHGSCVDNKSVKEEMCSVCGGTGVVLTESSYGRGPRMKQYCKACNSKGYKRSKCTVCRGRGTTTKTTNVSITIPAGIKDCTLQTETPEGHKIFIEVHVNIPPDFAIDPHTNDIYRMINLTYPQCLIGGMYEINMADGLSGKVKLPTNIQPGQQIRIKGKGLPVPKSSNINLIDHYADMVLEVKLLWPASSATDTEKVLLEQLQALYQLSTK